MVPMTTDTHTAQAFENNYAFIDSQNVHKGVADMGWKLDWRRFRVYLQHKHHVTRAFLDTMQHKLEYGERKNTA